MQAYVLHGPGEMRLEERPVAEIGEGDVLIRVRRTGICGSDVHYYLHGRIGDFVPREPFALGHEFSGEVAATGRRVERFAKGSRVAVDPQIPCRSCAYCVSGRYNLCTDMRFLGSASCYPHIDGGFGQYVAVPARNCYPLPDTLDYGRAALLEPLTVATHAVMRVGAAEAAPGGVAGKHVLITGAGTIGQLVLVVARAYGASVVAVSDVEEFARTFAVNSGADYAFHPADEALPHFAQEEGIDVVIEASGIPAALAQAITLVRRGGTVVQVGTLPATAELPIGLVMGKELTLLGSFRSAHVMKPAVDLVASVADIGSLISSVFPFSRMQEAMETAVAKRNVIKVQVEQESCD